MAPHNRKFHLFSIRERIESFSYAFKGLWTLISTQHNAWVHFLATTIVIAAGLYCQVSNEEWIYLILSMAIVWMAEALNTAMEFLCDAAIPEFHPLIEKAKDVAAGAVLISAIAALTVGIIVFGKYFIPG